MDVQSFGFVIDLIPTAFQTNGGLSAADFLARSRGGRGATGTAGFIVTGVTLVGGGLAIYDWKPWIRIVMGVAGVVLLILGLIHWQSRESLAGILWDFD